MKKKILSFMILMILTLSVYMTAIAAEEEVGNEPVQEHNGTAAALKSYGTIVYQKGQDTIKIDSKDLYMLAGQIDQIKLDVTNQLKAMNTYFTAGDGISLSTNDDISISHSQPSEDDTVDPLSVNFDTMLEGIAASQSISTDVSDYGYPSGTKLYSINGSMTTDGSDEDAKEVTISSAAAEDLSAGAAAWVNGELIIGNGANDNAYYKRGVVDGQANVIANPKKYGVNVNVLCFINSKGNTYTYTIPKDGTYTFRIITTWDNSQTNHGTDNKVTLEIGSEIITVFNYYYDNAIHEFRATGSTNETITRQCTKDTKIKITTSETDNSGSTQAYTSASLLIY